MEDNEFKKYLNERYYYNARVDDYGDFNDPMGLFIKRVEALISRENTLWLAVQKQKKENSEDYIAYSTPLDEESENE